MAGTNYNTLPFNLQDAAVSWIDVEGDGDLDFIYSGRQSILLPPVVHIYLRQGTSFQRLTNSITPVYNGTIAPADFDNDGDVDLFIAGSKAGGQFEVGLYQNNGSGFFSKNANFTTDFNSIDINIASQPSAAWGDYDNDGDPDLLFSWNEANPTNSPQLRLYTNTGIKLDESVVNQTTNFGGSGVINGDMDWGDYDQDGLLDIAITGETGSSSISRVLRNLGNNQFQLQPLSVPGFKNGSVQWGDYDLDGLLDLLFCGESMGVGMTQVYRNTGTTFSLVNSAMTGIRNGVARWGDYRNNAGNQGSDGYPDVIIAGFDGTTSIIQAYSNNNGSGFFNADNSNTWQGFGNGTALAIGDFNEDQSVDILIAGLENGTPATKIFERTSVSSPAAAGVPTLKAPVVSGNSVSLSWSPPAGFNNPLSYNIYLGTTSLTDDEDGAESDLLTGERFIARRGEIADSSKTYNNLPANTYYWSVQGIESNYKGTPFATEGTFTIVNVLPNNSSFQDVTLTGFSPSPPTGVWRGWMDAADFDADGDQDFIMIGSSSTVGNRSKGLYLNDGNGNFRDTTLFYIPSVPELENVAGAIHDFNNDNYPDLLITGQGNVSPPNPQPYYTGFFQNNGGTSFSIANNIVTNLPLVRSGSVDGGDFDGDGDIDILITGQTVSGRILQIYENQLAQGNFTFTLYADLSADAGVVAGEARWADFDNDGDLDFAVTGDNGTNDFLTLVFRNSDGVFDINDTYPSGNNFGLEESSLEWGDLNNDGLLDLVVTGKDGSPIPSYRTLIFHGTGNDIVNAFNPSGLNFLTLPGFAKGDVSLGDFNDDGLMDIFMTGENASGGISSSRLYFRQGTAFETFYQEDTASSNLFNSNTELANSSALWADFDGDQKLDLMLTGIDLVPSPSISYQYYRNIDPTPNISPLAPAQSSLTATLQGFDVLLEWDPSLAAAGLPAGVQSGYTYNIYVDTVPPAAVSLSPLADTTDGYRRIVKLGNAFSRTEYLLKELAPNTTYYWGVQAIDQDFEGSNFVRGGSFFYDDPSFLNQTTNVVLPTALQNFEDAYLRWGDYNENGELDLLIAGGENTSDYGVYFLEQDGGIFTQDININGNIDPVRFGSIDLADADNDGDIDILIAGETNSGPICKVYRDIQAGQGATFGGINVGDIFSVPGGGISDGEALFGDYNNDGLPDILMTGNRSGNPITELYLNQSTPGNLSFVLDPISTTLMDMFSSAAVWADFNNDGWLDFAIQGRDANLVYKRIYSNDQNGGFNVVSLPGQKILGGSLEAGDFDADGWVDLITSGELFVGTGRAEVIRNTTNNTFAFFQNIPFLEKGSADWADFNHDGYLDIAMVGEDLGDNSTDARFLIYDPALPGSNFVDDPIAAVPFPEVGKNSSVAWGDYDEDGRIDLAIAGFSGLGNGGALAILQNINANPQVSPPQPSGLSAQVIGNEVILDWNPPAIYSLPIKSLSYNVSVRRSGTQVVSPESEVPNGWRQVVKFASVHDTTRFRLVDLAPGTYDWAVQAITSDYEGGPFTATASFDYLPPSFQQQTQSLLPFIPPGLNYVAMAWGDYSNDGDLDLAIMGEDGGGNAFSRIYEKTGSGFDTLSANLPQLAEGDIAWADIDQDQDLDLIMSGRDNSSVERSLILENQAGTFVPIASSILGLYQSTIDWGDYDYDGDLDFALMGNDGSAAATKIYRNNGDNTFSDLGVPLLGLKEGGLQWLDYDKDGFLDLLLIGNQTNNVPEKALYRNDGNDNFNDVTALIANNIPALGQAALAVVDYNFDGYPDIAVSGLNGGSTLEGVLLNFNINANQYNIDQSIAGLRAGSLAWGDYDDDGRPDLLQTGSTSTNADSTALYSFDGSNYVSSLFPALALQNVSQGSEGIWGDFDQDGKLDIVLAGTTSAGPLSPVIHWYQNIDSTNQNFLPGLPENLSESIVGDTLIVQWTPPSGFNAAQVKGLSYQLCMGTTASNAAVISPMSDLITGYRRIVDQAIAGGDDTIKWKIADLADNTYQWSVQTIDQDFEASGFPAKRSINFVNPAFVNVSSTTGPTANGFPGLWDAEVNMADYDNDGELEFLVLGGDVSNNIGLLYQRQVDGTYIQDPVNTIVGLRHAAADWGDFNGDGYLDLIVIGDAASGGASASPTLRYYQNNGSGQLSPISFPVSGVPPLHRGAVDWGDYDHDGDLDLAIMGSLANSPQPYTKIFRNDNGSLVAQNFGLAQLYNGDLEWGDINGDTYLDLVVSGDDGTVNGVTEVYINQGFQTPGFTALTGSNLTGLVNSRLSLGDVNQDGLMDVLLTGKTGPNSFAQVLRYNAAQQNFVTNPGQQLDELNNGDAVFGDYNNDGRPDVIITGVDDANQPQTHVYSNNSGTFIRDAETSDYLRPTLDGSIGLGDFDLDGKLDFLIAGESALSGPFSRITQLYRNIDLGNPTTPPAITGFNITQQEDSIVISWNSLGPDFSYNLYMGDAPVGNDKIRSHSDNANGYRRIVANGNVGKRNSFSVHSLEEITYYAAVQAVDGDFEGGPFTAEQSIDYVQPHFVDMSALSFGQSVPTGLEAASLVWVDVDVDGDLDIIAAGSSNNAPAYIGVLINENGLFEEDAAWSANLTAISEGDLAVNDFDNDGDPDLALAGKNASNNGFSALYTNNGAGFDLMIMPIQNVSQAAIAWGDLNNDGSADVIFTGDANGSPSTQVFINNGEGSFGIQNLNLENVRNGDVEIVDVNRDQLFDIVICGEGDTDLILEVYYNQGENNFAALQDPLIAGLQNSELAIYDLNDDQLLDIVIMGEGPSNIPATEIYLNEMGTGFTASTNSLDDLSGGTVALGDYNDDASGLVDLFISGKSSTLPNTQNSSVYASNGTASFSPDLEASDPIFDLNLSAAAWGDYDLDGKLDLLLAGRTDNTPNQGLKLYRNVEGTANRVPSAPGKPQVKATGLFAEFSWAPPADAEAGTYTYNLYLEKVDDGSLIVTPMADLATGLRQVVGPGNVGMQHSMTIFGLEFGNYRCRVQAIGPDWEASMFSDTTNFPFEPSAITEETGGAFPGGVPAGIYNGDIILADYYQNDNRPDLILTGQTAGGLTTLLYHNINGQFREDTLSKVVSLEQSSFAWGDFDLDGQIDIFHMGRDALGAPRSLVYLNRDDKLLNNLDWSANLLPLSQGDAAAGDLDNDGDMDLIISGSDANGIASTRVYLNESGNGFVAADESVQNAFDQLQNGELHLLDYDKDGRLDVLLSGEGSLGARCRLYRNEGGLNFVDGTFLTSLSDSRLDWGDFNNDGLVDILLSGDQAGSKVTEIWSREAGTDNFLRNSVSDDLIGVSGGDIQFVDIQNDGWLDIFLSGTQDDGSPTSRVFQNFESNNMRRFQEAITTTDEMIEVDLSAAAWGDFALDDNQNTGKLDLILMGDSSSTISASPAIAVYINVDSVVNIKPNQVRTLSQNIVDSTLSVDFKWEAPLPQAGRPSATVTAYQYALFLRNIETDDTLVSAVSNTDGYRQTPAQGAINSLEWSVSGLPDGTYEWGVQAIDQDFEASDFSTETFIYTNPVPEIIRESFVDVHVNGSNASQIEIEVNNKAYVKKVLLHYKGIAAAEWDSVEISSSDEVFSFDITEDLLDEIGLRYWFEVKGVAIFSDTSTTGHTYIRYNEGLEVTGLAFGKRQRDYNIISVPLELDNGAISAVVEDQFGTYNKRQWRFFHYQNERYDEYKEGIDQMTDGLGYWLITKSERTFNTGAGETVKVTEESPYVWNLQQGWNQVGNPYNFKLAWQDIRDANAATIASVADIITYNDGFKTVQQEGTINNFRGGFIFADAATTLSVPVLKNTSIQRLAKPTDPRSIGPLDHHTWEVPITVATDNMVYPIGGVGMNPLAKPDFDQFDQMLPPRLGEYLDMHFKHDDYFYPWFAYDVVPTAKSYVWEFTVESNLDQEEIQLKWDNSAFGSSGKQLILFDVERQLPIDMATQTTYSSWSREGKRQFKVYYGWPSFIEDELQPDKICLGQAYPNPAPADLTIPFTLPASQNDYQLSLMVTDMMGRPLAELFRGSLPQGFHEVKWDGTNQSGARLPAGVYLFRLSVEGYDSQGGRIILR
ncbi:MAG: FG-GAP-like repeat-containing protein [Bacteroidota bacterium]